MVAGLFQRSQSCEHIFRLFVSGGFEITPDDFSATDKKGLTAGHAQLVAGDTEGFADFFLFVRQ